MHTLASGTPSQSCFLCSTPRTGSTLLCALLASTGVAGQPQSYFRAEDRSLWAQRWGISPAETGTIDFSAFTSGTLKAGTSANGVFSVRVMWGSMEELVGNLSLSGLATAGTAAERLGQVFGSARFLWLRRRDTLAQAISWARAEQTRIWHRLENDARPTTDGAAVYDFRQIRTLEQTIRTHNSAWQAWFARNGITPLPLTYEALDTDAPSVIRSVLAHLGLDTAKADNISSRNIRLADQTNLDWAAQYRRDLAAGRDET